MKSIAFTVAILITYCIVSVVCQQAEALSCDSCGHECQNACGTRHFRTCCFNYLRKRSSTPPLLTNRINPYDVAEMWLARAMKHNAMLRAPVDSWYDSASDSDMSNEVRRPQGVGKFMVYTDEGSKNSGKGGDESAETVGGRAVLYDS